LGIVIALVSCGEKAAQSEIKPIHSEAKERSIHPTQNPSQNPKQDSLVDFYSQMIHNYYASNNNDAADIELNLDGKIGYENDSLLILTFNETLKYGSWHRTNSSLCFKKKGNALIPIKVAPKKERVLTDYYQSDLFYPNRMEGELFQVVDLTGDGQPEYIFHETGSIRTNFEEFYSVYHFNAAKNSLKRDDFSVFATGVQGNCNGTYGDLVEFKIIEKSSKIGIKIKKTKTECNSETIKVELMSQTTSFYVWNQKQRRFIKQADKKE